MEYDAEAIADAVLARRVRQRVVEICEAKLSVLPDPTPAMAPQDAQRLREERYWLLATLQEAAFALGDLAVAEQYAEAARALDPPQWMLESTAEQLQKLGELLERRPRALAPEP